MDRYLFYRRNLPHYSVAEKLTFITFDTLNRRRLPPGARTLALRHALHEHGAALWMRVAVVMPDHVHLIFSILGSLALPDIMRGIKGVSSRRINQLLGGKGPLWQDESFDHVVRNYEWSQRKVDYVCDNPVRAGIVRSPDDYPWLWRSWIEGGDRGSLPAL